MSVVQLSITVTDDLSSLGVVRRYLHAASGILGVTPDLDTVDLLSTELMSNAVRLGCGEVLVVVRRGIEGSIRVEVRDHGYGLPELTTDADAGADDPPHALGLTIVDRLARDWGVDQYLPGKTVWFEV